MSKLTPRDLETLQGKLRARATLLRDELQRDARHLRTHSAQAHEPGSDSGELASSDHAASVSAQELAIDAEEMAAVERALEAMARGTYGRCAECGESIATPRLFAQPTALRCLDCQDKRER